MEFPFSYISNSEEDTTLLANMFSTQISDGMTISLIGDLGAGKTFFIKKLLLNFGINNANSPTFSLVNQYIGNKIFYHFDFYRINKEAELVDIGITDYFNDEKAVTLIEWANLFSEIIPKNRIEIEIIVNNNDTRTFTFKKYE